MKYSRNKFSIISIFSILIIFQCFYATAQSRDFIQFYTGEKIFGDLIKFKTPLFGKSYFLIDTIRYSADKVKFYQNKAGFFINTKDVQFLDKSSFYKRTTKGKIDIYESSSTHYYSGDPMAGGGVVFSGESKYYTKNDGKLKKLKFQYLKEDLADNPKSAELVRKTGIFRTIAYIGVATGFTMAISGGIMHINNNNMGGPIAISGIGVLMLSNIPGFLSLGKLRTAIDVYNME